MTSSHLDCENPYAAPPASSGALPRGLNVTADGELSLLYDLTLDDVIEFSVFHHFRSPYAARQRVIVHVVLLALLLFAVIAVLRITIPMMRPNVRPSVMVALLVILFIASTLTMFARSRLNLRRAVSRLYSEGNSEAITGWHRLTLSPTLLRVESENLASTIRCAVFLKVVRSPRTICCYYTAVNAILIPLRAFADEAEIQRFMDELNARMQKSK